MNSNDKQLWLVRTKTGDILGPFRQSDLEGNLKKNVFTEEDEIAPPNTPWIRASILLSSSEEVTRTATRNQTLSQPTVSMSGNAAPKLSIEENIPELRPPQEIRIPTTSKGVKHAVAPFLLGSILVVGIWSLFVQSRQVAPRKTPLKAEEQGASSEFLKTVYGLLRRGEHPAALEILRRHHASSNPSDYPEYAILMAAIEISIDQNTSDAKRTLTKILSQSPTNEARSAAHRWLGFLMLAKDEGDMGENHFLEALQLDPKNAAARFNLGRAYLKQERFIQALDYFQLAELELPDLWLIHIYKGRARSELGQFPQAEKHFLRAVELEPDRWLSYIYHALFLASRDKTQEAEEALSKMILRDPKYEQLSPVPWGFFQERTNYQEYQSVFSHIMSNRPAAERTLGKLLIQFASTPSPSQDLINRLLDLAKQGSIPAKLAIIEHAVRVSDRSQVELSTNQLQGDLISFGAHAYLTRARALALLSRPSEAERDFKSALDLDRSSAEGHWSYAEFLGAQGRRGEMTDHLERLLAFHPEYIPAIVANLRTP